MVSRNFSLSDAWLQSAVFAILWAAMLYMQISNMILLKAMEIQYSTHLETELKEDRDVNPKLIKELSDIRNAINKIGGYQQGLDLIQSKGLSEYAPK